MAGIPAGGNTLKNVILGVLTTVVAYAIVHYTFDKKAGKKEVKKQATIEAWQLLMKYEHMSIKNYYSAACIEDPVTQLESMIYEKDQLVKNYEIVRNKADIDEDMAAFVTRAIGFTEELKRVLEKYLADYKLLNKGEKFGYGVTDPLVDSLNREFERKKDMLDKRDKDALETTYTTLVEKYGDEFNDPQPVVEFQAADFEGNWKEAGIDKKFRIRADETFTMTADGVEYPGKWKYLNKTIELDFDDGSLIKLHVKKHFGKTFVFTMNEEENERLCCEM